ncbi:CoA transferase [Mycolicibacterium sp.]|uniref:CoA transferase n=1 Tax=Mycolicibacterium sp. TaxID=2320850 RepID=UPI0037C7BAFB
MGSLGITAGVLTRAQQVADGFTAHTGVRVDAAEILTGRAALLGIAPRRRVSAGGATRLLAGDDGWGALTLSRPDDIAAVPALLHSDTVTPDPWPAVEAWTREHSVAELVERARLLGMPAAILAETPAAPPRIRPLAGGRRARPIADLLVADLSSMWAGPLCAQLLAQAGATVVKVEHPARPDGTRAGPRAFFDWMNSGKLSYAVTFDDAGLAQLLSVADVVIESSRPGALARRGLGPETATRPGRVWLRITGHGADQHADWVAFGDDAAVSGGLVGYHDGAPVFVGDAIADPLTGLEAARAVTASLAGGGAELIECVMASVAATYAGSPGGEPITATAVSPSPAAAALGADNETVRRLVSGRATC